MKIGIESVRWFESLFQRQIQLFPDSCDMGVKLDEKTKIEAREHLRLLREDYESTVNIYGEKSGPLYGSTTEVKITWEQEGSRFFGQTIRVTYHRDRQEEFLCVDIFPSAFDHCTLRGS